MLEEIINSFQTEETRENIVGWLLWPFVNQKFGIEKFSAEYYEIMKQALINTNFLERKKTSWSKYELNSLSKLKKLITRFYTKVPPNNYPTYLKLTENEKYVDGEYAIDDDNLKEIKSAYYAILNVLSKDKFIPHDIFRIDGLNDLESVKQLLKEVYTNAVDVIDNCYKDFAKELSRNMDVIGFIYLGYDNRDTINIIIQGLTDIRLNHQTLLADAVKIMYTPFTKSDQAYIDNIIETPLYEEMISDVDKANQKEREILLAKLSFFDKVLAENNRDSLSKDDYLNIQKIVINPINAQIDALRQLNIKKLVEQFLITYNDVETYRELTLGIRNSFYRIYEKNIEAFIYGIFFMLQKMVNDPETSKEIIINVMPSQRNSILMRFDEFFQFLKTESFIVIFDYIEYIIDESYDLDPCLKEHLDNIILPDLLYYVNDVKDFGGNRYIANKILNYLKEN